MSNVELSKAEQRYFHPDNVIEFGLPERCGNCPNLNQAVSMLALNKAFFGETGMSGLMGPYLASQRQKETTELMQRVENCTGFEKLTGEEVDTVLAREDHEDYGGPSSSVGFRCAATGEIGVATTYPHGIVGLLISYPQSDTMRQ